MNWAIIVVLLAQLIFTLSDLMARTYMPRHGFSITTFVSLWFFVYFSLRMIATFGQFYVFTTIELGRTVALFSAVSIIFANLLGLLLLKEVLSPGAYIGVTLAILAFLILAFS